jgi:flotillin
MDPLILIFFGAAAVVMCMMMTLVVSAYKRCAPNQAMIISGLGTQTGTTPFMIVRSGGSVVLPCIQSCSFLDLSVRTVELKVSVPSDGGEFAVTAQVKIKSDDASLARAAESLLNKTPEEFDAIVRDILTNRLLDVASKWDRQKLSTSIEKFSWNVESASGTTLDTLGIFIVSLSIREISEGAHINR